MPRPGLFQRLQRRPGPGGRPAQLAWSEVLVLVLARLLSSRQGARARHGLAEACRAARELADEAAIRGLADELARGVGRLDPRLSRITASILAHDDDGVVRLLVRAHASDGQPAGCVVRLSPCIPPQVHRAP